MRGENEKMSSPISKKEFIQRLSAKMETDEKTASIWLEGITDTLYKMSL